MNLGELAPLLDLGASGLLLGAIIWLVRARENAVGSGEWVPKRELDYTRETYQAQLADRDRQIERADRASAEWRAAHETSEKARELSALQVRDLTDAFRVHGIFFDAFRDKIIEGGGDIGNPAMPS